MGGLNIALPLLSVAENDGMDFIASKNANATFSLLNGTPSTTCNLSEPTGYNYCGMTIVLGEDVQHGRDLSLYKSIELDVDIQTPGNHSRVRFSLRNFNRNYSKVDDYVSLKFNSIKFAPHLFDKSINVPLNAFQVDNWWVEQFFIDFSDAHLDFSNVAYAEILTDEMSQVGEYKLTVRTATLTGELLSEIELMILILLLWLVAITLLIAKQRNRFKTVSAIDSLTGLLNRRGLSDWVTKNISVFSLNSILTMFYFDIDDFKKINDSYGHLVGDELLCRFCEKLSIVLEKQSIKSNKYVFSRLSGDEFAIVFKGLPEHLIEELAGQMISVLNEGIVLSSNQVKISVSLGVASSERETKSVTELMAKADSAMYFAKKRGKNQFKIFDESVSKEILFRKQVAEKIRLALQQHEFELKYMPIYHAKDLKIYGAEVLLRCVSKRLEGIGPDVFIPIAEEFGIIQDIDLWVIEATFKKISENKDFMLNHNLVFAINISAVELRNRSFCKDIIALMQRYHIKAKWIEMELTETSLVETDELSISILQEIRDLGIKLSLDDFGTGYTAFSQLMHYPVDCLKIDKSFVDDICAETESKKTMIKAILSIAGAYKLATVAEGIEHIEQYEYMTQRGCDMMQGYFFSKPVSWQDLIELHKESLQPK